MNRRDFQALALARLTEARALLDNGMPDGAYYLSGYVVECALKACIAKQTRIHDFPPEPSKIRDIYTHDLVKLLAGANLSVSFAAAVKPDPLLQDNWETVRQWSEQSRYLRYDMGEARAMYVAMADGRHGVLRWIRNSW